MTLTTMLYVCPLLHKQILPVGTYTTAILYLVIYVRGHQILHIYSIYLNTRTAGTRRATVYFLYCYQNYF